MKEHGTWENFLILNRQREEKQLVFAMCLNPQKLSNNLYALWTGNVLDEYFVPIFTLTSISGSQAVNILLSGT